MTVEKKLRMGLVGTAHSTGDSLPLPVYPARELPTSIADMKGADAAIAAHIAAVPDLLQKIPWSPTRQHGRMFYRLEKAKTPRRPTMKSHESH